MMKKTPIVLAFLLSGLLAGAQLNPSHLLCENLPDPIAIDAPQPRFSWQLADAAKKAERALAQSAYEIRVAPDDASPGKSADLDNATALTWSSGRISSDQSVHIVYGGQPLQSGRRYYWQVRVWDAKGHPSRWSEAAAFRMALLNTSDWKAQWIEPGFVEDSILRPSPFFRKKFTVAKRLRSAIAYITAHGLYDASLNGKRIGDALLTPGWTSYNKRLQYQTYDVTNLLQKGDNAVGVMLGSGWYRGNLAWAGNHNLYGKTLGLLFQLTLTYTDGTTGTIVSDNSWKSSTGEIVYSEIYNGEIIDARLQKPGWTTASYDDAAWSGVHTPATKLDNLVPTWNEPVKKHEILHPVRIFRTPAGELVADFGQNMVGWVHVNVKGAAGDSVKIFHAEVLDKHGNFYTTNLRAAKEENIYILRGSGAEESFEPHFTWQGFRYIRLEGFSGELKPEDLYASVLYSDMPQTGAFSCSDPLLNQLQHNIEWGLRGNFLDVPTDCPQRDERLGWTGDAQVFSRTASFLRNVDNFFAKWLRDVAADQFASGAVPHVIPNVLGNGGGSTGWSDVSTIVPWNMYLAYGDKKILETQYPGMKAWIGYMIDQSHDYLWNTGGHFGDWLSFWPEGHGENAANTDSYLIAQTFFAHSTQLVIDAARVLGHQDDVEKYTGILQKVKAAFQREYATPDGRLVSNTQTAYTLALQFDMLPEAVRHSAAERLVRNIRDYKNHLTTGFLGTPYLCHVLSRFGYTDVAYTLLLQQTYPSWLYPVKMGATTIWERWDGQKTDSSFEDAGMNSFNHYAYGAIGDWLYRVAAGIDTYDSAPGYKKIRIMPHPTDSLTYMNADLDTYYGHISSHWKHEGGHLTLDVTIPINTTATIYIPTPASGKATNTPSTANTPSTPNAANTPSTRITPSTPSTPSTAITESDKPLSAHPEIKLIGQENGYIIVETGSGNYHFQTN
jgi:alpha-L-rhamnosidase